MNNIVYHGTAGVFDSFDSARKGKNFSAHAGGFWFGDNPVQVAPFAFNAWRKGKNDGESRLLERVSQFSSYERRWHMLKLAMREEFKWGMYDAEPVVPGDHWKGAIVLTCEIDGEIYQGQRGAAAPGVNGWGDHDRFECAVREAKTVGCVGVMFPGMLEGVGADLMPMDTTLIWEPSAIRIVARSPALDFIDRYAEGDGQQWMDFQAGQYADFLIDDETHLPHEDGRAFYEDEDGNKWLACGDEASDSSVVTYNHEPTCEHCRVIYKYGHKPKLFSQKMYEYLEV